MLEPQTKSPEQSTDQEIIGILRQIAEPRPDIDELSKQLKLANAESARMVGGAAVPGESFDFDNLPTEVKESVLRKSSLEAQRDYLVAQDGLNKSSLRERLAEILTPEGQDPAIIHVRLQPGVFGAIEFDKRDFGDKTPVHPEEISGNYLFANPKGWLQINNQNGNYWVRTFDREGAQQVDIEIAYPQNNGQ